MERHNRVTPSYHSISSQSNNHSPYLSLNQKPHSFQSNPPPSTYLRPQPETPRRLTRRSDDVELSIFDAERYFNDTSVTDKNVADKNEVVSSTRRVSKNEVVSSTRRVSSVSSVDSYSKNVYRNGYIATPTPSSEASWNSQSGLLSNPNGPLKVKMRSLPLKEKPKMPSSPSRRMFTLRCPCVGKKSLEVDEKKSDTNVPVNNKLQRTQTEDDGLSSIVPLEELTKVRITSGTAWPKDKNFIPKHPPPNFQTELTRTIATPRVFSLSNPPINKPIKTMPSLEPPRESLEVFGAKPPRARIILKTDEEQLSDTSSDLFELDSFCGNSYATASYGKRQDSLDDLLDPRRLAQVPAGLRRNSDETAQSECGYPPSEVSIQWSVTTAEGFDRASVANFSSAASDFDELRFIQAEVQDKFDKKKTVVSGGGLLSCRSDKAVQVRCNSGPFNRPVHMR